MKNKEIDWVKTIFVSLFIWGVIVCIFVGATLYAAEQMRQPAELKQILFYAALMLIIIREMHHSLITLSFKVYKIKHKTNIK